MAMNFQDRIEHLIQSGFQAVYIPTAERSRCEDELVTLSKKSKFKFVTWDAVAGFNVFVENGKPATQNGKCKDPIEALISLDIDSKETLWDDSNTMFIMRNFHVFLEDPTVRQQFQNLYYGRKLSNFYHKHPIFIVSNALQINQEISPCIIVSEFSLPTEEQLSAVFSEVAENIEDSSKAGAIVKCEEELQANIIQAMRGLTTLEAENILAYSLRVNRGFAPGIIDTIEDQKATTLEKSEVLTYIPKERIASMNDIGGYDELKTFINMRKLAYTKKARELNLDLPRGIVLIGVPGSGKSVVGKILSREMGLPLVLMNISAIFGSLVGESERRIRTALETIDALDGSVVLIDEAEKALGGADQSVGDSGVSRRVFGVILTWLTEKRSRTFVVLTMNRVKGIPPEFLRVGRFDAMFYTDLPTKDERDQILRIHCKKRSIDCTKYKAEEWKTLLENTNRYVGAELEQIVCDARFAAFEARKTGQPTLDEFLAAAAIITPIADAEQENMDDIKKACEGRARPVSKTVEEKEPVKKARRIISV